MAVVVGWLAAIVLLELFTLFSVLHEPEQTSPNALFVTSVFFSLFIWAFALPVWFLALVPLALFVPPSSPLWSPPICTACGAVVGALVVAVRFPVPGPGIAPQIWFPYALGAVVGGITCFVGSVSRHRFA